MELWVRSQDKETLIKIENISRDSENYIIGNLISDDNKSICDYWRLGHYKTKERALEVLDEIEEILHPFVYLDDCIITGSSNGMIYRDKKTNQLIEFSTYVYEMPEE